ncbi:isoprenylcysteine carboxylmethyltransferase family protein [Pseudovibrio sp. SPO723]|nr:isoprenylcysteine carboxylmethyltransferase family protein [Pseudovibrio sp. SPO723]
MKFLEMKVPPVAVSLLCAALMWVLAVGIPGYPLPRPVAVAGFALFLLLGLGIGIAGVLEFRRLKTTVDPTNPQKVNTLVTSGVYKFTRNPMYIGMLIGLVGWAIYLSSMAAFLGLIAYVGYMNKFQIEPEERALREKFSDAFEAYEKQVRRWL